MIRQSIICFRNKQTEWMDFQYQNLEQKSEN